MALDNATASGAKEGTRVLSTPITVRRQTSTVGALSKRVLDLLLALSLLAALSIPIFLLAVAVKVTSPGPVIFRQLRVGRNGRLFTSYKFRSMYVDAEGRRKEIQHLNEVSGPIFKIRNDPRITRIGRFLRRTSLDELPQLFNVVRGEMSLVGPRPALMPEVVRYEPSHLRRLTVKPGMTGRWQVSGRSELPFDEMMQLDLDYVDRWSFWLDLSLLLRTIPAVVSGRGAY